MSNIFENWLSGLRKGDFFSISLTFPAFDTLLYVNMNNNNLPFFIYIADYQYFMIFKIKNQPILFNKKNLHCYYKFAI